MKNYKIKFKKRLSKGFTLVELLVVIAILAIMAAALVATIDPFEQIKKSQDSKLKSMTVEFVSANQRYFGTNNAFPWDSVSGCAAPAANTSATGTSLSSMSPCLQALVTSGELKQGFVNASSDLAKIYAAQGTIATDIKACFQPQSKSQKLDPSTKYTVAGGSCTPSANSSCFWCTE